MLKIFCIILCLQNWVYPFLGGQDLAKIPQEVYFDNLYHPFSLQKKSSILNDKNSSLKIVPKVNWKLKNIFLERKLIIKFYSEIEQFYIVEKVISNNYLSSLKNYPKIIRDIILQKEWSKSLSGQRFYHSFGDLSKWNLPVKIPNWLANLDFIKPRINISGSYQLLLAAKALKTSLHSNHPRWIPSLEVLQIPKFAIVGTIGDRIVIEINSENGFDNNNLKDQLKIKYNPPAEEAEDEIIQEIELGNTSLALPGTNLTGYTEQHKGLFGIKSRFKFGNLYISVIASIEGSTFSSQSLQGNRTETEFIINDVTPSLYRHFFLELADRKDYQDSLNGVGTNYFTNGKKNIEIEVWTLTDNILKEQTEIAIAFAIDSEGNLNPNIFEEGRWIKLKQGILEDYDYNSSLRILNIFGGNSSQILAVRWTNDPLFINRGIPFNKELNSQIPDTLILLKKANFEPTIDSLMLRNIYSIGFVNKQDQNHFKIKTIQKSNGLESDGNLSFNQKLGLTKRTNTTSLRIAQSDVFDFNRGLLILPCRIIGEDGLLLPPDGNCLEPLNRINPETQFYTKPSNLLDNISSSHQFVVTSRKATTVFNVKGSSHHLNGDNCVDITPNTERILLNNSILLERDKDYDILYEKGEIILTSAKAKDPNATIDIDYECTPFFQVQDEILLGSRIEYLLDRISKNSLLGGTLLYKRKTTSSIIPQLGFEPFDQFLWGVNLKIKNNSLWMTQWINYLPFIQTDHLSNYNIELEIVQSLYNGNLKGTAFIDDFENSEENYTFSTDKDKWFKASPIGNTITDVIFNKDKDYRHEGISIWHSNLSENFSNIFGLTENRQINASIIDLLTIQFIPNDNLRGNSWGGIMQAIPVPLKDQSQKSFLEIVVFGKVGRINIDLGQISEDISIAGHQPNLQLDAEILPGESINHNDYGLDNVPDNQETALSWQCLPICKSRILEGNFEDPSNDNWIESHEGETRPSSSINGTENNNQGTNGLEFDTEDLTGNGSLNTTNEYLRYQINLNQACQGLIHCETLEGGWQRYEIPLQEEGFYQIFSNQNTTAKQILLNTSIIRVSIDSLPNGVSESEVFIAELQLKGNLWESSPRNTLYDLTSPSFIDQTGSRSTPFVIQKDSNRFSINVINNQKGNDLYQISPQTIVEKNTDTDDPLKEQSLVLKYHNLHPKEIVSATQIFPNNSKNMTQYNRLSMEVYPNKKVIPFLSTAPYRIKFALQLGHSNSSDSSSNYYEIEIKIDSTIQNLSPTEIWNKHRISVSLADLSSLKSEPQWFSQGFFSRYIPAALPQDSLRISVIGNPSLSNIDWIRFVIKVNDTIPNNEQQSGEIWINDLRLTEINNSIGTSLRTFVQLDFSDVLSLGGNITATNGSFKKLTQQKLFPSQLTTRINYNSNIQISLDKFFPNSWKVSLPINFSLNGSIDRPLTKPSSDIFLHNTSISDIFNYRSPTDPSQASFYETKNHSQSLSFQFSKDKISHNIITQLLLERPKLQWSFKQNTSKGPQQESTLKNYTSHLSYDLSIRKNLSIIPFKFLSKFTWIPSFIKLLKINLYPNSFYLTPFNFSYKNITKTIKDVDNPLVFSQQNNIDVSVSHGLNIDWKLLSFFAFNYRINIQRDLDNQANKFHHKKFFQTAKGFLAHTLIFRGETVSPSEKHYTILFGENYRNQSFQANFNPQFTKWLTTSVNFFSNYSHNRNELLVVDSNKTEEYFRVGVSSHQFQFNLQFQLNRAFSSLYNTTKNNFLSPLTTFLYKQSEQFKINYVSLSYSIKHNFSGEEFKLKELNQRNYSNLNLLAYQFGFVYDPAILLDWSRFKKEILLGTPRESGTIDYLTAPLVDSNRINLSHQVNRDLEIKLPHFYIKPLNILVVGNIGWNINYTFHRDPLQQRNIDTSLTWPKYNISTSFHSLEKWFPKYLSKRVRKVSANSSYTFRKTHSFNIFNQNNENYVTEYNFNPLLKFNGETHSNIYFSNSFNFSFATNTLTPKILVDSLEVLSFRNFGINKTNTKLKLPIFQKTTVGKFTTRRWNLDNILSIQKDLHTEKGFQFWKWYFRLKSNISIKNILKLGWNRTINDNFNLENDLIKIQQTRIKDEFSILLQPEINYNFSNVNSRFFLQYRYIKEYQTIHQDTEHFIQFSAIFTIRL